VILKGQEDHHSPVGAGLFGPASRTSRTWFGMLHKEKARSSLCSDLVLFVRPSSINVHRSIWGRIAHPGKPGFADLLEGALHSRFVDIAKVNHLKNKSDWYQEFFPS